MTISHRLALALLLVTWYSAIPRMLGGQPGRATLLAERPSPRVASVQENWFDDPATARLIASRILTTGAPSTYQIVSISIPDRLPRRGVGQVEIIPREGFTVLGTHRWLLPALEGKTKVIGIIGIPANAHAGLITAADVNFQVAGSATVTIAVEIDVSLVRDLAVRINYATLRARPGSQLTFAYELVNTGNTTEIVETLVAAPKGWKTNQRSGPFASIAPDGSIARQVVVAIPRDIATGSFFLRLDVVDKGVVRSSIPVPVEVLHAISSHGLAGSEITIAVARASDASGRGRTITTGSMRGPLFDSVRIDARFSVGENASEPYGRALSRLGAVRTTPSLVLSSPSGSIALGAAGNSFSDLTGLYAYGKGAALDVHRSGWHFIGLGAIASEPGTSGKSQPLLGARADLDVGPVTLMSSLSHLRAGDASRQQLDAASVGASLDAGFATTIQGEVARRRFAGGSGTGWSTEIMRADSRNSARLRVTHAPGGSEAFARAVSDVVASITQIISRRLSFSSSVWRLSDATAAFARQRSSGWAIRPEYRVHSSTTVALEAHATDVSAITVGEPNGGVGGYGGTERQAGVTVSSNVRQLYVSGSVAGGSVSRTIAMGSTTSAQRSPKIWWNGMAKWRGSRTIVELQGRMEEARDASGAVKRPSQISLRGSRSVTTSPGRGVSADWEVQQIRGFSARPATVVRTGITVPVTEMLAVKLYAERNPLFTTAAGKSPWIYAVRIEHSARVPMIRPPGSSGYVYRDLDGNQRRDHGEPGVDGVIVKRGGEIAVTDASGKYRLAGDARSSIVLDESSLPLGWVRQSTGSKDIAVGSTLNAEIRFFVAARSTMERVEPDLAAIHAIARDASGKIWVARMTGASVATFDALPPGTYTLELDLSAVDEPLVPREPLPLLKVTAFEPSFVVVVLDPRPLRIWRAQSVPVPAPSGESEAGRAPDKTSLPAVTARRAVESGR